MGQRSSQHTLRTRRIRIEGSLALNCCSDADFQARHYMNGHGADEPWRLPGLASIDEIREIPADQNHQGRWQPGLFFGLSDDKRSRKLDSQ